MVTSYSEVSINFSGKEATWLQRTKTMTETHRVKMKMKEKTADKVNSNSSLFKRVLTVPVCCINVIIFFMTDLSQNETITLESNLNGRTSLVRFILFGVVIVAGFLLAFYAGKLSVSKTEIKERDIAQVLTRPVATSVSEQNEAFQSEMASEDCDIGECLFNDKENNAVIGYATINGYYTKYTQKDWGDTQVTCEAFVIKDGSRALIDNFREWVKEGNSINKINDKGELVVNIDVEALPINIKSEIRASSSQKPINLAVIRNKPRGMGASGCFSFLEIIAVR